MLLIILAVAAIAFFAIYYRHYDRKKRTQCLDNEQQLLGEFRDYIQTMRQGAYYVRKQQIRELTSSIQNLASINVTHKWRPPKDHPSAEAISVLQEYLLDPAAVQNEINERYTQTEVGRWAELFNTIEKHPLNAQQSRAVVSGEKNNRLIAGAGTGKTSTIIARTAYILRNGLAREDQVLLLAFGNKAAEVLRSRIRERTGHDVTVKTFHALGLEIVGKVEGG